MTKEKILKNFDVFDDAIRFEPQKMEAKHFTFTEDSKNKTSGLFHSEGSDYFLLYVENGQLFFQHKESKFNLSDKAVSVAIATMAGESHFKITSSQKSLSVKYKSWRSEAGLERDDVLSDFAEEDDIDYDFFYYIYAIYLDSNLLAGCITQWS